MPYERRWLLKNRVCYVQLIGKVSLDDVAAMSSDHETWLKNSDKKHNIHYIIDSRMLSDYPRNFFEIKSQLVGRMNHIGWLLLLSDDYFIKHIGDMFGQLFHFKVRTCASVVEAYRFLQAMDEIPVPDNWPGNLNDTMPMR